MNGDTRLSRALDSHPDVLELIVSLNPHDSSRLRHSRMRRPMAPRITLRRAAAMAGIPEAELVDRVNLQAGEEAGRSLNTWSCRRGRRCRPPGGGHPGGHDFPGWM